jgi:hypothetical protein
MCCLEDLISLKKKGLLVNEKCRNGGKKRGDLYEGHDFFDTFAAVILTIQ